MWKIRTARLHTWREVWEVAHGSPGESISRNWTSKIDLTSRGKKKKSLFKLYLFRPHLIKCFLIKQPQSFSWYSKQVMGWTAEESWFDSLKGKRCLSFPKYPDRLWGPQPPIQWVSGQLFSRLKRQGSLAVCSPTSTVVNSVALRPFLIGPWSFYFPEIVISISSI
jgi:hypothetical protein